MSMIERLGLDYCHEYLRQALMVYEGRPAQILDIRSSRVTVTFLDSRGGNHDIPASYFTGWKVLAYPELGYRRINDRLTYYVYRSQTAYRGLRHNVLTFENTPMSYLLSRDEQTHRRITTSTTEKLSAVMCPRYDGRAQLDALVAGSLASVVPNQNICIEPSTTDDSYIVLYHTKIVGSMDRDKNFTISNPAVLAEVQAAFRE